MAFGAPSAGTVGGKWSKGREEGRGIPCVGEEGKVGGIQVRFIGLKEPTSPCQPNLPFYLAH